MFADKRSMKLPANVWTFTNEQRARKSSFPSKYLQGFDAQKDKLRLSKLQTFWQWCIVYIARGVSYHGHVHHSGYKHEHVHPSHLPPFSAPFAGGQGSHKGHVCSSSAGVDIPFTFIWVPWPVVKGTCVASGGPCMCSLLLTGFPGFPKSMRSLQSIRELSLAFCSWQPCCICSSQPGKSASLRSVHVVGDVWWWLVVAWWWMIVAWWCQVKSWHHAWPGAQRALSTPLLLG